MINSLRAASRLLPKKGLAVTSVRTHLHFNFEPDEAPAELGGTEKMNMCNAIKDAIG